MPAGPWTNTTAVRPFRASLEGAAQGRQLGLAADEQGTGAQPPGRRQPGRGRHHRRAQPLQDPGAGGRATGLRASSSMQSGARSAGAWGASRSGGGRAHAQLVDERGQGVAGEGQGPGEHLVEHRPEAVPVRRLGGGMAADALGGHVGGSGAGHPGPATPAPPGRNPGDAAGRAVKPKSSSTTRPYGSTRAWLGFRSWCSFPAWCRAHRPCGQLACQRPHPLVVLAGLPARRELLQDGGCPPPAPWCRTNPDRGSSPRTGSARLGWLSSARARNSCLNRADVPGSPRHGAPSTPPGSGARGRRPRRPRRPRSPGGVGWRSGRCP